MATAGAAAAGEAPAQPQQQQKAGLWDSLSPSEQKKAVTVFLCSLGVTLLITGRSGGKLLKRAKATETTTATSSSSSSSAGGPPRQPPPPPPPPSRAPASTSTPTPTPTPTPRQRPQAPPISFLHPDELTPGLSRRRRVLPSFVLPASVSSASSSAASTEAGTGHAISVLGSASRPPAPSSYFLPNPTIVAASTAFADELDKYDKLHEEGERPPPASEDDGFNPAVFAMKALGIATVLSVGTFAAGIYGVMRYLGVQDVSPRATASDVPERDPFDLTRLGPYSVTFHCTGRVPRARAAAPTPFRL